MNILELLLAHHCNWGWMVTEQLWWMKQNTQWIGKRIMTFIYSEGTVMITFYRSLRRCTEDLENQFLNPLICIKSSYTYLIKRSWLQSDWTSLINHKNQCWMLYIFLNMGIGIEKNQSLAKVKFDFFPIKLQCMDRSCFEDRT